jgi:hypothetical protein
VKRNPEVATEKVDQKQDVLNVQSLVKAELSSDSLLNDIPNVGVSGKE